MDEFLTDVTISKVYHVKDGEGQYGKWQLWNFYVKDDKRKFNYFSGGKKPVPVEGMFLKMVRYKEKRSGEYTNYNVEEIFTNGDKSTPKTSSEAPPKTKKEMCPMSFIGAFVKDLLIDYMEAYDSWSFEDVMKTYRSECQKTYDAFNYTKTAWTPDTTAERDGEPRQDPNVLPDGREFPPNEEEPIPF